MAQSPAHQFGQIIGEIVEAAVFDPLQQIADEHGLYLDYKHLRPARGGKRKVSWKDRHGNDHDLDYVLEQGGSEEVLGRPKAFIETAWRRYTKHSRNKAQEIQGAILPLAEAYADCHPFRGVVLAGVFTAGSLAQLETNGFKILYFPYSSVIAAFADVGIEASFDEATADAEFMKKVNRFKKLSAAKKAQLITGLCAKHAADLAKFLDLLRQSLRRGIDRILVIPLYGASQELRSIRDAVAFIRSHPEGTGMYPFVRYAIVVGYSNGNEIRGDFRTKEEAIDFLERMTAYQTAMPGAT
ncbi:MAG TPA: hypothetical protein VFW87_06295 [Pirellulales bacterium]|nr:hypothetical protein [Pirellulales bacterium]